MLLQCSVGYPWPIISSHKLHNQIVNINKITCCDFDWDCIQSIEQLQKYWHLNTIESSSPWTWNLSIYLVLLKFSLPEVCSLPHIDLVYISLDLYLSINTFTFEGNLAVSIKLTYSYHTIQQLGSLVFIQRSWKLYPHKICTKMSIASWFRIAKTWKQPRYLSVGKWINKPAHSDNGVLCIAKKKGAVESWKDIEGKNTKWKKPIWKGCLRYAFNYITFWKRQNMGTVKRKLPQRKESGMNRWSTEEL